MIISHNSQATSSDFTNLLIRTQVSLEKKAITERKRFSEFEPSTFEIELHTELCKAAENTKFQNTIELISGKKFPDIVINKKFGVEVKTTKRNHWKSTGNSVFENTRIDDVERIYIYFAKLADPIQFKFRKYQECLYDVAVTHSPRYLINMDLLTGESIFEKLGIDYDKLRLLENPTKPIIEYYRKITKTGEEPWWMSNDGDETFSPMVKLFSNLDWDEKNLLINSAMAFFPEVFGNTTAKYQRVASWLAARHGVVDSSLRDRFTAGGKVEIIVNNKTYKGLPRIFKNLSDNIQKVAKIIETTDLEDLRHYWGVYNTYEPRFDQWARLFIHNSTNVVPDNERFLVSLISHNYPESEKGSYIKEQEKKYGIK